MSADPRDTPIRAIRSTLVTGSAHGSPVASPISIGRMPCANTSFRIAPPLPTRAMRNPIACVRCWIERAITVYKQTPASASAIVAKTVKIPARKRGLKPVSRQPLLERASVVDRQIRFALFHHPVKPVERCGGGNAAPRN
jgi:hypothetical protein